MSVLGSLHERLHRRFVFDRRRDRLARAIDACLPSGSSVIDIGCGNGEIGSDLVTAGHRVVGVETLERDHCSIPFAMYDGRRLPFGDGSVEWATIVDVLHHAADPVEVVAEAARVASCGVVIKDHTAESRRHRLTLAVMDWVGNRQFGVGRDGAYLSRQQWQDLWVEVGLTCTMRNEQLDLYPRVTKPVVESGLHFVARLEHDRGQRPER